MAECLGEFLVGGAQVEELAHCGCGLLHEDQALCERGTERVEEKEGEEEREAEEEEEEEGSRRGVRQEICDVGEVGEK